MKIWNRQVRTGIVVAFAVVIGALASGFGALMVSGRISGSLVPWVVSAVVVVVVQFIISLGSRLGGSADK